VPEAQPAVPEAQPAVSTPEAPKKEVIPEEVLNDPEQARTLFFQKMEKKTPISESSDIEFMDQELELLKAAWNTTDIKFRNTLKFTFVNLRDPTIHADPEIEKMTKILKDVKRGFFNKTLYGEYINSLISVTATPPSRTVRKPSERDSEKPIADVEQEKEESVTQPIEPPQTLPPKSIANEIKKREKAIADQNKVLAAPGVTDLVIQKVQDNIDKLRADINSLRELQMTTSPAISAFNLSKHIKHS
jgi:hypothetical protein